MRRRAAELRDRLRTFFTFDRLFLLVLALTIFLRFSRLDFKLYHHDEAIHGWFSYRLLHEGIWSYDPSYHGPLLYYATAGMFWLLGDGDVVGRLIPSLLGTLVVALVYPLRRMGYLSDRQALLASLFLALSPDMVYFSRFLRHDIFMLFFLMLLLVAILAYIETGSRWYGLGVALAVAGGIACKEEFPVILLVFGSYFIYAGWTGRIRFPPRWRQDLVIFTAIALGIILLFYSSLGAHPEILPTAPIRAIEHWSAMHEQNRLPGPWYYYILLFIIYDLPIFVLAIIGSTQLLADNSDRRWLLWGIPLALCFCFIAPIVTFYTETGKLFAGEIFLGFNLTTILGAFSLVVVTSLLLIFLKKAVGVRKKSIIFSICCIILLVIFYTILNEVYPKYILPAILVTLTGVSIISLLRLISPPDESWKQTGFTNFCIYWLVLTMAFYAYVSEKVPWLILPQLLPAVFVAVYRPTDRKTIIALASVVFLVLCTWHTSFYPADVSEPIVQVQNSEDLRGLFAQIDTSGKVAVASKNYWPLPWYYRGGLAKKISYYGNKVAEKTLYDNNYDLVIAYDAESYPSLDSYTKRTIRLDYWFSLYDNENRLLEWYFLRDGKLGSMNFDLFTKVHSPAGS